MRPTTGLIACLVLAAPAAAAAPPATETLAITRVAVIDATAAAPRPGMTVVVRGGRIVAVGESRAVEVPRGARVVDGSGRFLIPGLWDMHVHLGMGGEGCLPLFVASGVTGVRDLGGDLGEIDAWRRRIAAGVLVGPRIKAAGPVLESPRFLDVLDRLAEALGPEGRLLAREAAGRIGVGDADDARRAVDSLARMGVDVVKFRTVASPEVFHAIAREARRAGMRLAGHEPPGVSLIEASDAGQGSVEHAFFSPQPPETTAEQRAERARRLILNGTWLVPTLISGRTTRLLPPEETDAAIRDARGARDPRRKVVPALLVDWWRLHRALDRFEGPQDWPGIHARAVSELRAMHAAGVGFLAGTDFGARLVHPGSGLHDELALLVEEVGMSPLAALTAATLDPARYFGLEDSLGTVAAGRLADLVLLDANPLDDVRNARRIHAVVLGGRYLDRAALDRLLARAAAAAARD